VSSMMRLRRSRPSYDIAGPATPGHRGDRPSCVHITHGSGRPEGHWDDASSPAPSNANPANTLAGRSMARPPANPSVAKTARSGSKWWAANLLKQSIAGEPNGQHGEGVDRKTHSGDQGHGVQSSCGDRRRPNRSGTSHSMSAKAMPPRTISSAWNTPWCPSRLPFQHSTG